VRLASSIAVALTGTALLAAPPTPLKTAVFTLDAEHHLLIANQDDSLADQLDQWASRCRIEPADASLALSCLQALTNPPVGGRPGPLDGIPATLALFWDLDETAYLAGCPLSEEGTDRPGEPGRNGAGAQPAKPDDIRDCEDIAAGQTFSAEVEDGLLRIVIRGRQLPLRIFTVREKPKAIYTPYISTTSPRLPDVDPRTTRELNGLAPQNQPRWEPPQLSSASSGKPSVPRFSGAAPAHTSLRTGRLTIECASREVTILIDGVYMGACPATTLLLAGPHTLTLRSPGETERTHDIHIGAGGSLRFRAGENEN